MEKFVLDMSSYIVEVTDSVEKSEVYPLRENLSRCLRCTGVFQTGEEIVEAVILGKQILKHTEDELLLDAGEATLLKKAISRHIDLTYKGNLDFGGPVHEELISRVFSMKPFEPVKS